MPANTSPDNIQFPTAGDQIAPLNTVFQNLAQTTQTALTTTRTSLTNRLVANVADFTALAALSTTGKLAGDLAFVVEGQVYMSWTGTIWRQATTAIFATVALRNTAYAKAAGVYLADGARVTIPTFLAEQVYRGAAWNFEQALVRVLPTSVAGTGTTLNAATGLVSFTNATEVILNGCFSSAFRNYQIVCDAQGAAGSHNFELRAGATNSTTGYDRTEVLARNASLSSNTTAGNSTWALMGIVAPIVQWEMIVNTPNLPIASSALSRGGTHSNPAVSGGTNGMLNIYFTHQALTAFDGFRLALGAAQSGTIRVYGLN